MAAPPTRRDPPTPDDASAGLGAATLAQLVAAGAAVGPAAMGAVGRGALVGAGSLPAATAHAIAEAVERALDGFWMQQLAKARDRARTVIGEAFPSWTPSLVDKAVAEELAYEDAFRRKSRKRWARDLPAALAHSDPAERRRALQALLDRERRYAEQRYAAVIRRVHARVERERVRDASPLGAYWTMDPRLKTHTPGCVALAGQFWPWAVIDRVHPPVHASCGCRLWSLDDAVRRGWMRPDQVPDEADAVRRAQMLARRIAELHSDLGEAALRELSEAIAKDAAYDLRYPKGTAKGGQYRPRRGYDAGGLIKRHVRRDLRKLLEPPAHASLRDDRENRRVNGRSVSIPWATHWRGTVGGRRYFSPPQSTNVYEEHVPVPRRAAAGIVEDLKRKAAEIVTGRRSEALDSMRARLAKNEPPIAKGDPVDRLSLLPLLGFRRTATNQSSERGRPAVEDHFRSADGRLVTVRRGNAAEGYTDVLGARIENATGPRAKALKRPPRTFEEFEADTAAYAQRLGEEHGRVPGLTDIGEDASLQDTAAYRDWDGMLRFGPDARAAVEAYAAARREHRQPTADEALGMYIAQATALHEASHAVNPEYEYQFDQPGRRWAEEALAEELATADVGKHLKETGQKAVLRWAADHPDHIQLEGNYHQPRIVLASALDRAGIAPEDREAYLRRLKFDVDPNERLDTLAADMAKHSGTGKDEELRQLAANLDNPNAAPAGAPWTALPALPPEAAELRAGDGPSITVVAQDAQTLGHHGPMTLRAGTRVNVDGEGNGRVMSLDPADGGWTAQVAYEDGNTGFIHGLGSDGYAPTELAVFPPERVNGIEEGARVAWTRPDGKETRGTLDRALLAYPGGGWAFEGVTEDGRRAVVTSSNTKGLRALAPAELAPEPVPLRDNPRHDALAPTSDSIERSPGRTPEFRDWNPGEWGKGLILPDGSLEKWGTDKDGYPHHQDYADAEMAGDLWGSGVPVVITPDGFATVTDELYLSEPALRDEFSKGPATATGRGFYTAGEWFGDELPSYEDPAAPAWEYELKRRRDAASSAVRGAGLKWEPDYDRWYEKRALPELDKWETGREGSPGKARPEPWTVTRDEYAGPFPEPAQDTDAARRDPAYMARVADHRRLEKEWEAGMERALTLGTVTPERAYQLKFYDAAPDHPTPWRELPPRLYHVTTAADAVRADGRLRSRDELGQALGHGLGAGASDTISLTDDPKTAEAIRSSMLEAAAVARGDVSVQDMLDRARTGDKGSRPFLGHFYGSAPLDGPPPQGLADAIAGRKRAFNTLAKDAGGWAAYRDDAGNGGYAPDEASLIPGSNPPAYMRATRPMTADEATRARFDVWKNFSAYREWEGGPLDPLYMSVDVPAYAKLDPAQVQVVEAEPVPGARGTHMAALNEWRVRFGDALRLRSVGGARVENSPGRVPESVNNWYPGSPGKAWVWPDEGRVIAWNTDAFGNPEHGLVADDGSTPEGDRAPAGLPGMATDGVAARLDSGAYPVVIDPDGQVHDAYATGAADAPLPEVMRALRSAMGSEVHARQGRAENSPGRATAGLYRGPLYHVADAGQRESIAAHGIDDTRAPYERSTSGAGFYAFADPGEARWYAEYMAPEDPAGPMDVYEVRTDGPVELDAGLGTDGPTSAVRVLRPATGQRLAATYDPRAGWSGDAPDPPATDPRPPELVRAENSPGAVAPGRPGGSLAATRTGDDAEYRIGTAAHAEHLASEETKALLAYTDDPRKMSDAQRQTLAALVARHPLPEPVVAYRKAAPGELDGAKAGDAITEDRLRSASMGPTYGIGVTDDNGSMRLSLPAGTPAYYNPHNDSEHELILPPGLRLRVDSVAQSGGKPRVAATAVPLAPPVHGAVADPPGERSPGAVPSAPPLRPEFVEMVRRRREEDAQGLERMANPRKWAHDRGMTDGEYEKAVADHVGGLARSADLVVRLDEKYLPAFLEGHVANQHEVDHSGGMYDPVRRARAEAGAWDIAGAEPDRGKIDYSSPAAEYAAEHPDRFPVYGYLSMGPDRPSPDESSGFYSPAEIGNNAGQYGGAKLVLRPEVKDRTYLFLGDSLGPIQDGVGVPSPALAPSPLSAQVDPLDYTSLGPDTLHFEDPETAGDPAGTETSPWPYTEAEIFGGVRPGDVDHVELAEEPTGELAQQLEKAGVAWTVGQQGAPDTSVSTAVRRRAAAAAKIMGDAGAPYSEAVDEMGNWPITDADRADILKDYPGAADHASVTAREESPGRVQRAVTPAERERLIRAAREAPPKKNWLGQKPHVSGVRRRGFGPTPLALLVSTGQPDMARYATPALGRLLVPGSYGQSDEDAAEGVPFAADNGGFWGVPEGDYKRMAEELSKGKTKPLWVTVPDVFVHPFLTHSGRRIWAANRRDAEREAGGRVREDKATPPHGDADATMARFEQWSQYLRHEGLPAAFVAQDGMDSPERLAWLDRHWGEIEAVFIGGSDEFKLGPGAAKVARLAHEHGKLVHVGRVNTHQRIAYARDVLGADSIDGGTFSKFKDTYLPSGLAYIPTAGAPPTKAGQEWVRSAREALDGEHAWPRPPGRDRPQWPRGFYPLAEAADAGTVGYQELADALSAAGLSDYLHLSFQPGTPGFTVKGTPAQRGWVAAYLGVEAPSGEQWPQLVLPGGDGEGELALAEAYVEGLHPRDRTGRWAPRPWQLNGPWRGAPQGGSTFASDRMARQAFRAPRLDPDQRAALERYRGDEYQQVNDALRGGREASPGRARDDVALMDAAVGASEATEPVTLYRGLTHSSAIPQSGEFVDRGFVSASLTENTATYFSGAAHGTEPHPDQTLAEIRLPAGAHALALAAEVGSAEGEVILPRGSAFRVVGRTTERWTTRSGAPASVTHVVLEYLGSRGGKGLSEARRAPQGAAGRFFWAPGDVEPAELEEGLYDEHLHPRGRSGQWVRAFHGGGTNMPHASPVETAAWVEKRLGLPEGSVQNHRWLGFSRDRAHDPWSYWTTDRGMAERYAAIGSEPLDDALTAAYAVIRDIKPDQDTPDHWQRDLTAFKVKFLKDNGIEPHVTERRLTPEDVAASSNYQGYLKNVEASPAKDGKPPLSPEEWLAAANGTGEVTLMLPRADLPAHLADAVRQGGATLDLSTGEQPSEGFAVAVGGHSGITKTEEFLADPAGHYERWLEGNADAVDAAGHVGVWRDDKHGEVVLDPVEVFSPDRRAEAIAAGRGRDQQSIYDLKAGVEIPTGGTGGREGSPGRIGQPPAKLYHSASRAYRDSVRQKGLLTRNPVTGESEAVADGTPEGVYLFEYPGDGVTPDMRAYGGPAAHDIWEVDTKGLRLAPDPASEVPAWYSPDPIPPDRVRLHDARVPSVSSGWKMLAPGEYEHASGWHISRINYGHGDEWTAVTPDGYALDPLPTLKRARAAAELSIEDERGREQSPGSARDQRKREQAEAAAEWARLAPGDRFEVKSDGSSGPVAIAGYEVVRNDSDAYGPSLRVRDESGRETTLTPDLGSRPHMAGPADGRPFAKGEVVVRPNGKKASVLSVDGDRVTVVYRSGRSNGQQTFRASQLGRA